jgi:primosomal protein N' (replication factor Y)
MPEVRLVDWGHFKARLGARGVYALGALSPPLLDALQRRLDAREQSLLLLNRRGYAPVLHCRECAWKSECPHCSAWRVFHKTDGALRCHHCGFSERPPRACPQCGYVDIQPLGRGTERLEEQLAERFPQARIGRIDADTTRAKGELEAQLASMHAGEIDILVGTQMVAKGHDFRRITLVAAIDPDAGLFSSDFRAPERLFSLLMQSAGRAGRDVDLAQRSEMWVQTWHPDHPLYQALKTHDFKHFAATQLQEREEAGLPPFVHLALLRVEAREQAQAQGFLNAAVAQAADLPGMSDVLMYPPIPAPMQRIANIERAQILLEATARPVLQRLLAAWQPILQQLSAQHKGVLRWVIDVDPLGI